MEKMRRRHSKGDGCRKGCVVVRGEEGGGVVGVSVVQLRGSSFVDWHNPDTRLTYTPRRTNQTAAAVSTWWRTEEEFFFQCHMRTRTVKSIALVLSFCPISVIMGERDTVLFPILCGEMWRAGETTRSIRESTFLQQTKDKFSMSISLGQQDRANDNTR